MRRPVNLLLGAALVLGGVTGCAEGDSARVEAGPGPGQMPAAGVAQPAPPGFAGIYPFTSAAELDAYAAGADQTFRDPVRTAREFATQFLGFTAPDVTLSDFRPGPGSGAGEVSVSTRRGDQTFLRTNVALRQLGPTGPGGPWTVVGASSPDIVVDRPQPLDQVSSPVAVSGRGRGFEGTISLEIREDGMVFGQSLGQGFALGGSTEVLPFSGSLSFRAPSRTGGALLFQDRSGVGPPDAVATTVVKVLFRGVTLTG